MGSQGDDSRVVGARLAGVEDRAHGGVPLHRLLHDPRPQELPAARPVAVRIQFYVQSEFSLDFKK